MMKMTIMASAIRRNMMAELPNAHCFDMPLPSSQNKTPTVSAVMRRSLLNLTPYPANASRQGKGRIVLKNQK